MYNPSDAKWYAANFCKVNNSILDNLRDILHWFGFDQESIPKDADVSFDFANLPESWRVFVFASSFTNLFCEGCQWYVTNSSNTLTMVKGTITSFVTH